MLLAVKSYDHRWLAEFIKPYLKPDGVLVGVMNGMNDDSLASIIGRSRTVGCVVELSAEIFTPGPGPAQHHAQGHLVRRSANSTASIRRA